MFYDSYNVYLSYTYFDFCILNFSESGAPDRMHGAEERRFLNSSRHTQPWAQWDFNTQQYCSENFKSLINARSSHLLIYFSFSPPSSILLYSPPRHLDDQFCGNETIGFYNIPEVFSGNRWIMFRLVGQAGNFPRL
jgi:hypothetical protein